MTVGPTESMEHAVATAAYAVALVELITGRKIQNKGSVVDCSWFLSL